MTDITADRLVAAYIKMRDHRAEIKRAYETEDEELKLQQEIVSQKLQDIMKEVGADSLRTSKGTVTRTVRPRYSTNDWASMYAFVKEHDALELLQQRIHESNMKKFLEENPDLLPPGLNCFSAYTISVLRKK
jgi:hypothetical protein